MRTKHRVVQIVSVSLLGKEYTCVCVCINFFHKFHNKLLIVITVGIVIGVNVEKGINKFFYFKFYNQWNSECLMCVTFIIKLKYCSTVLPKLRDFMHQ